MLELFCRSNCIDINVSNVLMALHNFSVMINDINYYMLSIQFQSHIVSNRCLFTLSNLLSVRLHILILFAVSHLNIHVFHVRLCILFEHTSPI